MTIILPQWTNDLRRNKNFKFISLITASPRFYLIRITKKVGGSRAEIFEPQGQLNKYTGAKMDSKKDIA